MLDDVIARLLDVKGTKPTMNVQLSESEIKELCNEAKTIFLAQPTLLELEAPLKICGKSVVLTPHCRSHLLVSIPLFPSGDIHGQYSDLLRLFDYGIFPPGSNYLFLGDYVDRGKQSLGGCLWPLGL